ncbi:TIGR04283 family arsenosugar biosynthesis glycosyltransferase [Algibacter mikhailovii]|uniref:Glycosyl hydrolase n=1 Tax=Algibacter mikhailovii TaxID=425498 RepID=A0A918R0S7_9FLAO|nr:TIGR04283 family arsenosugar biosynthesis glycosyltransferase [Algibacter mikhailovii]GGZ79758.1 glycosyl hydrolase [Algibacter mikhailovii]
MTHTISIIIPVLNEESHIGKLLEHLLANSTPNHVCEILVVDGGSQDQTIAILDSFAQVHQSHLKRAFHFIDTRISTTKTISPNNIKTNIIALHSEKGRAKQMNYGAKHAQGDILYFLHADSFPPPYFDQLIINEIHKRNKAGCFRMQFNSNHWWLRLASWFTQFNWRPCRGGDQSQFISKKLFHTIGGFDENYTIYEDNILINHLYKIKQFVVINKKLQTSARMYETHGIWKLQFFYWSIYIKKWLGADATTLYAFYIKFINVKK